MTTAIHHRVVHQVSVNWPVASWSSQPIVLAISGGADSVALLRAVCTLTECPEQIIVAHFNHGWRGIESDLDQAFVQQLADTLGTQFRCGKPDFLQIHRHDQSADERDQYPRAELARTEQAARIARYRFLNSIAQECQAKWIATAHTATDRVETLLHNLCRGTGLAGVSSPSLFRTTMLPEADKQEINGKQAEEHPIVRPTIVRPLLTSFREEIIDYLSQLGQSYREDSSNSNQRYRRNFLRHSVLPLLRQAYGPKVDQRIFSFSQLTEEILINQQAQASRYWDQIRQLEASTITQGRLTPTIMNQLRFPCRALFPEDWPIVLVALQHAWHQQNWPLQSMSRQHWERLRRAWETTQPPRRFKPRRPKILFQLPGNITVATYQGWLSTTSNGLSTTSTGETRV